jgi:DUF3046 family protein
VRLSDFWRRLNATFGPTYASSVASDQVLAELGGRTVNEALEEGVPVVAVWRAVVATYPDRVPANLR